MSRVQKFLEDYDSIIGSHNKSSVQTYKRGIITGYIEGFSRALNKEMNDEKWSTKDIESQDEYDDEKESQVVYYFLGDTTGTKFRIHIMSCDALEVLVLTIGFSVKMHHLKWRVDGEEYNQYGVKTVKTLDAKFNMLTKLNRILNFINNFESNNSVTVTDDAKEGEKYGEEDVQDFINGIEDFCIKDSLLRRDVDKRVTTINPSYSFEHN